MKTIRIRDVLERELNLLLSKTGDGVIDEYYSVLVENFNAIDNALNITTLLERLLKRGQYESPNLHAICSMDPPPWN
jgi:hypothetical protein